MSPTELFFSYAGEFEKSYIDDDWSRVYSFFHDDARYEIIGGRFACVLSGPAAIIKGLQQSLDGMDRRFDERMLAADSEFIEQGNELRVDWHVTYLKAGVPPFVLPGRTVMCVRGDKIATLKDTFRGEAERDLDDWIERTGIVINPSYV